MLILAALSLVPLQRSRLRRSLLAPSALASSSTLAPSVFTSLFALYCADTVTALLRRCCYDVSVASIVDAVSSL